MIIFPLFRWVKMTAAVVVAFRRSGAPRRPGALLYGPPPGLASGFLRESEIFCRIVGRSVPEPGVTPAGGRRPGARIRPAGCHFGRESPGRCHRPADAGSQRTANRPDGTGLSSRYNASVIRPRPRHPRSGASPGRRSTPGRARESRRPPAGGGSDGRSSPPSPPRCWFAVAR